jgi:ribosomal protein S18 acetylase RimI-like enzyme
VTIESYEDSRLEAVVQLSLSAWAPVFASIERALDPEVWRAFHPDWRADQRAAVEAACKDAAMRVWVAVEAGQVAGFVAARLHAESRMGEIHMIAVDPGFQRRGIASALTRQALAWFESEGMQVAMVETGGDPGHAPARATYEATGFRLFPVARYFKKL